MDTEFTKDFFEQSSKAWLQNKKKYKGGFYKYVCKHISERTGKVCKNKIHINTEYCYYYLKNHMLRRNNH